MHTASDQSPANSSNPTTQAVSSEGADRGTLVLFFLAISLARIALLPLAPMPYVIDEASWGEAGHAFWVSGKAMSGGFRFPFLYPALLSPLYGPLPYELAYFAARAVNVLLVTAAIFPIRRLGRSLLGEPHATGVAVLSVAGVAGTYSAAAMPECLFFLLFWLYLSEFRRLLEPTLRRGFLTGALATALLATKPQATPVVAVTVAALAVLVLNGRERGRAGRAGWAVAAIVVLLGFLGVRSLNGGSLFGSYGRFSEAARDIAAPLKGIFERMTAHVAVIGLGIGIAPFAAFPRLLRRGFWREVSFPDRVMLAVLVALPAAYVFLVGYFDGMFDFGMVHERYLFFCYPGLLIVAAAAWVRRPERMSLLAAIALGTLIAALLLFGLRLSPTTFGMEIVQAPSRAALWSGAAGKDTGSLPFGTVVVAAVVGGALAVAAARTVRARLRLALAGAPILALGGLITIAQIGWTSGWVSESSQRPRAGSAAIPRGAPVVVVSDGSTAATLQFEAVRHAGRIRILSLADAALVGAAGILNVPFAGASEPYWVSSNQIRLRGEVIYRGPGFQIYGPGSNRRLLAAVKCVEGNGASGRVEIRYYPDDVFLDEVRLVAGLSASGKPSDREALRIEAEAAEGAPEAWSVGRNPAPYELTARRQIGGGFRLALIPRGCGATKVCTGACFSLSELLARNVRSGRIIDVLVP